jgi:glyoxylase-like metal-dependent hydrolase (beta-lactamase superfamily II)
MNSFSVSNLKVHRIEEVVDTNCNPLEFYPELTPEIIEKHVHWMAPRFYDTEKKAISITMQTWLIQSEHHNIIVDTCNGNHKSRPYFAVVDQLNTPYLDLLKAAGCAPEDIDFVCCTHMHVDHVGWNTRLENGRWVPTFPKAKYLFAQAEYDQYLPENYIDGKPPIFMDVFEDSVLPVIAAGQAQMVTGQHAVNESIMIDPAPGHTPGHYIVRAGKQDDLALFIGDAIHNPIQIAEPQLSTAFCTDGKLAAQSRIRILEDCAEHGHLLVPTHFAPPHIGHVKRDAHGFHFLPGR